MKTSTNHYPSLFAALLFIVAAVLLFGVAMIMAASSFTMMLTGKTIQAQQTIVLGASLFEALIVLVAAFVAIQRYRRRPFAAKEASFDIGPREIAASLFLVAVVIFIGYEIGANNALNWFMLPLLTVPAVALPIFVLLGLGIRRLPLGTRWQSWGTFGIAMTLAPFILVILEVFVLFVLVFFVVAVLMSQPAFASEMQRMLRQLTVLGPDSKAAQTLLMPYITHPAVVGIALFYFAVMAPMIEEIFKPLAVWFSASKISSPAQGFALGALSGSAYALIETLGVSAQTADWASLLLSRIGTGTLHITTSALMGAAIVYGIRERRYLRLIGTYIVAVSLHGFWNALAILYSFAGITEVTGTQNVFTNFATPLLIAMVILAVLLLLILLVLNLRMRHILAPSIPQEPTS